MTVRELKQRILARHRQREGERFFTEKALLSALFGKSFDRPLPMLPPDLEIDGEREEEILFDLERLLSGYPLQYYLGTEFFCGLEFLVSPDVLIPRVDTEVLVEKALSLLPENALVFDFCCGSGCIGIALLAKRQDLRCVSFDLSPAALALTKRNCERFFLEDRMEIVSMDLLGDGAKEAILKRKPALVLSNPPYLSKKEMGEIEENVAMEPEMALFGGDDGLLFYRKFLRLCRECETPFLCEMGWEQTEAVREIMKKEGLEGEFFSDGEHRPRAFFAHP